MLPRILRLALMGAVLSSGVGYAALDCNVDGFSSPGLFDPSTSDVATLAARSVMVQPTGSCVGGGCDFNGDGVSPNVGDIAVLLKIATDRSDPNGVCFNEGDPTAYPVVTFNMFNASGAPVSNESAVVVKRDGTGMPSVRLTLSDPNNDLNASTLTITYKYGDLQFNLLNFFPALSGNQTETGSGISSPFFQTALGRYNLATLARERADLIPGSIPATGPKASAGGAVLMDADRNRLLLYPPSGVYSVKANLPAAATGTKPLKWAVSTGQNRTAVQYGAESGQTLEDTIKIFDLDGNSAGQVQITGGAAHLAIHEGAGLLFVLHQSDKKTISVYQISNGAAVTSSTLDQSLNPVVLVPAGPANAPTVVAMAAVGVVYLMDGNTLSQQARWPLNYVLNLAAWDSATNNLLFAGTQGSSQDAPLRGFSLATPTETAPTLITQSGNGKRPTSLTVSGDNVYVASNEDLTLRRLRASDLAEQATVALPSKVAGLTVDNSQVVAVLDLLDPEGNVPTLITAAISDLAGHQSAGRANLTLATDTVGGFGRKASE